MIPTAKKTRSPNLSPVPGLAQPQTAPCSSSTNANRLHPQTQGGQTRHGHQR